MNISQTRLFTVDLNGLSVSLIYPPNDTNFFVFTLNLSFNATDNIDATLDCNITVNNQVVNSSTVTSGAITNRSVTFSSGGTKVWNVTCIDDSSNKITSATRNFTIEQVPSVALNAPPNNTFQNTSLVVFFYDVLDPNDNIANSTLILNGQKNLTNQSQIVNDATNNFTLTLPDGNYNWTVNVTDLTNLEGTELPYRVLTIDTKQPWIILNYPINATTLTTNNITINYTAYDFMDSNLTCNVSIDEAATIINIPSLNGTDVVRYTLKQDGSYLCNVNCVDDSGNRNYSETRNFTVEAPPNVTLLSPLSANVINSTSVTFVYVPQDTIGMANCSLFVDNIFNSTDPVIEVNQNNSFSVSSVSEGKHNWTVSCTDAFPDFNVFTALPENFTIDVTPPNVTLNSPPNNTNTLKIAFFNISVIDSLDVDQILQCGLYIDNSLNQTNFNITNGSSTIKTVTSLTLGSHSWNATCIDDASNRGWSFIYNFNVTLADLMVNSSSIVFNTTTLTENESVMVNATVYNLINVTVTNITFAFYDGDPDNPTINGTLVGTNQTIATLGPLASVLLNVSWNARLGTSYLFVVVDPPFTTNGTIQEWNDTNNKANSSLTKGIWHFVYGNLTNEELFLKSNLSKKTFSWAASSNNGSIFVADSDSFITFINLTALGRTLTQTNATDDFVQADSLLNSSNFTDSITTLYSTNGMARNTTAAFVFKKPVVGIPIYKSILSDNFTTGILWDAADDSGNNQFDTSDREDLVFVSSINKGSGGSYSLIDYEIRIPATLRSYKGSENYGVTFYVELQ